MKRKRLWSQEWYKLRKRFAYELSVQQLYQNGPRTKTMIATKRLTKCLTKSVLGGQAPLQSLEQTKLSISLRQCLLLPRPKLLTG